ncbi:hypothetical protein ACFL6A_00980 [bacterium]
MTNSVCNEDKIDYGEELGSYIIIQSITPEEGSVIKEDDVIEAVIQYQIHHTIYDHDPDDEFYITIYFETTTGGHVIAGDSPSKKLLQREAKITHTYTVDSMDTNNGVVEKPYQVCYKLEQKIEDAYWEIESTQPVAFQAES